MTPLAQAISGALLAFLWQGLMAAAFLSFILSVLRGRSPQVRYLASCAALAAMIALPVITAIGLYEPAPRASLTLAIRGVWTGPALYRILPLLQPWVLRIWAIGVAFLSLRLAWLGGHISLLKRSAAAASPDVLALASGLAERMGVQRTLRVLVSSLPEGPGLTGWIRPVILLPSATILGLTTDQLEAILAHEIAHLRRYDDVVNILQSVVETLLFYHPAVWWVSNRIRHERELCCDDMAVRATGSALCYARALTALERLRATAPRLALGATDDSLGFRIRRIIEIQERKPRAGAGIPAALAVVMALTLCAIFSAPARASRVSPPSASVFPVTTPFAEISGFVPARAEKTLKFPAELPAAAVVTPSAFNAPSDSDRASTQVNIAFELVAPPPIVAVPLPVPHLPAIQALNPPEYTVKSSRTVVTDSVLVTDTKGRRVTDLTQSDFNVFVDGTRQPIRSFSYVRPATARNPEESTSGAEEVRRAIAIVVDDAHTSPSDLAEIRPDLKRFVRNRIGSGDVVSVAAVTGDLDSSAKFTADKATLLFAIDRATNRPGSPAETRIVPAECHGIRVRFDATMERVFQSIRRMREAPGRKALVLMTDGLTMPSGQSVCASDASWMRAEMATVAEQALRAGVSIYAQGAHGLETQVTDASSNTARPYGTRPLESVQAMPTSAEKEEVAAYLTSRTGGYFSHVTNYFAQALDKSLEDLSGYYRIAYELTQSETLSDHAVQVVLNGRDLLAHSTRTVTDHPGGYISDGSATDPSEVMRRGFTAALTPRSQFKTTYSREGSGAILTVTSNVESSRLPRPRGENNVSLTLGLFAENGTFISAVERKLGLRIEDEARGKWMQSGIENTTDFNVIPGKYLVRMLARDSDGFPLAQQYSSVVIP